jgi:Fuc2NAc and GlcNAc transferase
VPAAEIMICVLAACVAAALTGLFRRHAVATRMLDVPNSRSSHVNPTPRGGGAAIAVVLIVGIAILWLQGVIAVTVMLVCTVGGAVVAAVGYWDDKHGLAALPRFVVHVGTAAFAVALLSLVPNTQLPLAGVSAIVGYGALVLGIAWSINLFNFMDGIDGIAASEATFVSAASAFLVSGASAEMAWSSLCALTAGGGVGFLLWNWPPAKIFMGDVGSGFLGFWIAVVAVALHLSDALSIWTSAALCSIFLADATTTLLRRMFRGERWHQAHRSHAYQILTRRWNSHLTVTALSWAINVLIVLPLAYASTLWIQAAPWIAVGLILSLAAACWALGAGRTSV